MKHMKRLHVYESKPLSYMKYAGLALVPMTYVIIAITVNNELEDIDWISIVWISAMIGSVIALIFFIYLTFTPIHSYHIKTDVIELTGMRLINERTIIIKDIIFIGPISDMSGRKITSFPKIKPSKNRNLKDYSDEKIDNLICICLASKSR